MKSTHVSAAAVSVAVAVAAGVAVADGRHKYIFEIITQNNQNSEKKNK